MLLTAFLLLILLAAYPVAIYPVLVLLVAGVRRRVWTEGNVEHPVVHVITVHNEAARIAAKLDNALALTHPPGGLRTVVADDGSADGTAEIVESYSEAGVELLRCQRRGKEFAQIDAVRASAEPIVVFSDASTTMEPDALLQLIRPFVDARIAAVSGVDRVSSGRHGTGEDLYVRFEMALRRAESLAGSLVGLSGCFFAARREIAEQLVPDAPSDMGTALIAMRSGLRTVSGQEARCEYQTTPHAGRELTRKRRTALRGLRCLLAYPGALGWSRPVISWQLISHKWLRFAIPLSLAAAVIVAALAGVQGERWGQWVAGLGAAGALLGLAAYRVAALRRFRILRTLAFGIVTLSAVSLAWIDLARGIRPVMWAPTRRPEEKG